MSLVKMRRIAVTSLATSLILIGGAAPSFAAESMASPAQTVTLSAPVIGGGLPADIKRRWYGWDIRLDRSQTNDVMLGLGAGTAASLGIPDPTATKVLAAALGTYTAYANWVYNRGGCLKVRVTYTGVAYPAHYFGGNCT